MCLTSLFREDGRARCDLQAEIPSKFMSWHASYILAVPDSPQLEHKARQHRIPGDGLRVIETLHWCLWTVNIDLFVYWVDQPAELRAVVEVLSHFVLHVFEGI
jgi:hypothetical protein